MERHVINRFLIEKHFLFFDEFSADMLHAKLKDFFVTKNLSQIKQFCLYFEKLVEGVTIQLPRNKEKVESNGFQEVYLVGVSFDQHSLVSDGFG